MIKGDNEDTPRRVGDLGFWKELTGQRCIAFVQGEARLSLCATWRPFPIPFLRLGSGSCGRGGKAFSSLWPQRGTRPLRRRKKTFG